jgi:hypothetical protein
LFFKQTTKFVLFSIKTKEAIHAVSLKYLFEPYDEKTKKSIQEDLQKVMKNMKTFLLSLVCFLLVGCQPPTAEERRLQMESDLKDIDRMQQDRYRYEAKQQKAEDDMKLREAINKAKSKY